VTPTPAVDSELMTLWEQLDTKQRAKLIKKARKLIAKSTEQPNAKQKKGKKKKKGKKRK
ncbi:XRE family transcriptional regulator, partial [Lactiplantibacillus plantarum]